MEETKDDDVLEGIVLEENNEEDDDVLEGIVLEENNEEEREKRVRCRCYVGCISLWALLVYLLTDYYVSRIYISY